MTAREITQSTECAPGAVRPAHDAHLVVFYEDESYLREVVTDFLMGGLDASERLLLLVRAQQCRALLGSLRERGLDVSGALADERLTVSVTDDLLVKSMMNDALDEARLIALVDEVLLRVQSGGGRVRVYGELAGLLCEAGYDRACTELENHWSRAIARDPFVLLCAYRTGTHAPPDTELMGRVAQLHSCPLPTERSVSARADVRLQYLFLLERRVQELEASSAQAQAAVTGLRGSLEVLGARHDAVGELLCDLLASWQLELRELRPQTTAVSAQWVIVRLMLHCDAIAGAIRLLGHSRSRRDSVA